MDDIAPGLVQRNFPNAKGPLKREMTPLQRAFVTLVLFAVYASFIILMNGGRPQSDWFYPAMAIVACVLSVEVYRHKNRTWPTEPISGESKRRAMEIAIAKGVLWMIATYSIFALGLAPDWHMTRLSIGLGATAVYQEYSRRRGIKLSIKVHLLIVLVWLFGTVLYIEISKGLL